MEIVLAEGLADLISDCGLTEYDVKKTMEHAEKEKTFIIDGENIIGKYKMENMTVYVAYEKDGEIYKVKSVYSHRVQLNSELE